MKHDMNKKSGYYQGPEGLFYDFTHDQIFELEYTGAKIMNKKFEELGRQYFMYECQSKKRKLCITGMDNCIYLGEVF